LSFRGDSIKRICFLGGRCDRGRVDYDFFSASHFGTSARQAETGRVGLFAAAGGPFTTRRVLRLELCRLVYGEAHPFRLSLYSPTHLLQDAAGRREGCSFRWALPRRCGWRTISRSSSYWCPSSSRQSRQLVRTVDSST
jgi:hypothetical protein